MGNAPPAVQAMTDTLTPDVTAREIIGKPLRGPNTAFLETPKGHLRLASPHVSLLEVGLTKATRQNLGVVHQRFSAQAHKASAGHGRTAAFETS